MSDANAVTLPDTDTLSAIMRRQPNAVARAQAYLAIHGQFTFSIMTRYEILRGLYAKRATTQIARFERLCMASVVVPLSDAAVVRAAVVYADLHQRGELIGDADILIAGTALEQSFVLATNNTSHFQRISSLSFINWLV